MAGASRLPVCTIAIALGGIVDIAAAQQRGATEEMPAFETASTTCAIIGRLATGCRTFDFEDFMRVLSPAARMTARQVRSMCRLRESIVRRFAVT